MSSSSSSSEGEDRDTEHQDHEEMPNNNGPPQPLHNKPVVYEQLGAPSLIFRQDKAYQAPYHIPRIAPFSEGNKGSLNSKRGRLDFGNSIHKTWQGLNRVKSKWYLSSVQSQGGKTSKNSISVQRNAVIPPPQQKPVKSNEIKTMKYSKYDTFNLPEHQSTRIDPSLQTERLAMLMGSEHDPNKPYSVLQGSTQYDHPYISTTYGTDKQSVKIQKLEVNSYKPRLDSIRYQNTLTIGSDRRNHADPSYLADFTSAAIRSCMDESLGESMLDEYEFALEPPRRYGNCLVSLKCPCPVCSSKAEGGRSLVLVHPTGPLMDRVTVSNVIMPNGPPNAGHILTEEKWSNTTRSAHFDSLVSRLRDAYPNEISVDDTVYELRLSGSWTMDHLSGVFLARTPTHISVLEITCTEPVVPESGQKFFDSSSICWGNYHIREKHRIDLRSLRKGGVSRRPTAIACHPNYGNPFAPSRFAFVSECCKSMAQNTIHSCFDGSSINMTSHTIRNLEKVSLIDFSSTSPMCLWSAARSFVAPTLKAELGPQQEKLSPPFGRGFSLYSIDLRSDLATFQWSPSAAEYHTEGVHSISAIMTDWHRDNKIFVSSTTARKTWELDTRMPMEVVNTWSLPFGCDEPVSKIPPSGFVGEGRLLFQPTPWSPATRRDSQNSPILSLDKTPGTFGIHLYQRPRNPPRFQTKPIECIASAELNSKHGTSVAASSVFAHADNSPRTFHCGLAALRISSSQLLDQEVAQPIDGVSTTGSSLCVFTLTNKGDVYCSTLLENSSSKSLATSTHDLPLGTKLVSLPSALEGVSSKFCGLAEKPMGGTNLKVSLENEYPLAGSAIAPQIRDDATQRYYNRIDYTKLGGVASKVKVELETFDINEAGVAKKRDGLDEPVVTIPQALLTKAESKIPTLVNRLKRRRDYLSSEDATKSQQSESDDDIVIKPLSDQRSDLSNGILYATSNAWNTEIGDSDEE